MFMHQALSGSVPCPRHDADPNIQESKCSDSGTWCCKRDEEEISPQLLRARHVPGTGLGVGRMSSTLNRKDS